jgi:hypothetical protein
MRTTACLIFIALAALTGSISTAQDRATFLGDPILTNDYVRVAKISVLPDGTFQVPESSDAHILIATSAPTLTDISEASVDAKKAKSITARAILLEANRSYTLANGRKVQFEGLLLDLQKDPGKISCTQGNDCPWSIRPMDPVPAILSEHVTVFSIPLPWTPEARSLIIPESDMTAAGQHHGAGDPFWMLSPMELTAAATPPSSAASLNALVTGSFPKPDYFIEVAFYDKSFCFCKRTR